MTSSMDRLREDGGLPPTGEPDPWCDWCHIKIGDGPEYRIEGTEHDWPPSFCSLECAARWGNAAQQDAIYRVAEGRP